LSPWFVVWFTASMPLLLVAGFESQNVVERHAAPTVFVEFKRDLALADGAFESVPTATDQPSGGRGRHAAGRADLRIVGMTTQCTVLRSAFVGAINRGRSKFACRQA
jgi:hypothetical protein